MPKSLNQNRRTVVSCENPLKIESYRKIVVEFGDFLLELVKIHMVDVERLSSFGKDLLFDISGSTLAFSLSWLTTEIKDENSERT